MAARSSLVLCLEKQKLIKEFERAVADYNRMNSAQVAAVRNGEDFPFAEQIAEAGAREENANARSLRIRWSTAANEIAETRLEFCHKIAGDEHHG